MVNQLTLEVQDQKPPFFGSKLPDERGLRGGSLLANGDVQQIRGASPAWHGPAYALRTVAARQFGPAHSRPSARLEEQKRRRFNPEGKAVRVARSLVALNEEVAIR